MTAPPRESTDKNSVCTSFSEESTLSHLNPLKGPDVAPPREWWINERDEWVGTSRLHAVIPSDIPASDLGPVWVRVIEKSAYDALATELAAMKATMREALGE